MEKLRGIIPVLVSPVNEDHSIDEDGYHKLLDFTLASGIGGYWILGSASEDFLIGHDDRVEISRIIAERVNGRVPVIIGCGQPVVDDTYRFFDETAGMKIDAYHLLPNDQKMKPSLTIKYVTMVADRAPKPIWLYNNELRAQKIPVEAVMELRSHPNIVGIKAAGYDLKDILPFCRMETDDFQTIGSGGGHLLVFLAMGCLAHTISPASMFPKEYCQAYDLWMEGKLDESRRVANGLSAVIKALPHPENTEFSAEEKICLEILGICQRWVYPPFRACTDDEKAHAEKAMRDGGLL